MTITRIPRRITDINWQWLSVKNKTTNKTTTVPNPENYTIIFKTDDTFTGKADCNNISGTHSTASGFTIKLGPSTMAYCGETTMDQQYVQLVSNVAAAFAYQTVISISGPNTCEKRILCLQHNHPPPVLPGSSPA